MTISAFWNGVSAKLYSMKISDNEINSDSSENNVCENREISIFGVVIEKGMKKISKRKWQ